VHALLPPDYQGLTTPAARPAPPARANCRFEESERPNPRVSQDAQRAVLKPQMATGAKAFYNDLDARCGRDKKLNE